MSDKSQFDAICKTTFQISDSLENSYEVPVSTHRKGILGKLDVYFKRIVRKSTRFMLSPYAVKSNIFRQNIFNSTNLLMDKALEAIEANENTASLLSNQAELLKNIHSQHISDFIKQRWNIYDSFDAIRFKAHTFNCPICKHEMNTNNAEQYISKCIFYGGSLIRYRCDYCDAIIGPLKMLELSQEEFDLDYEQHYQIFSEGDTTEYEKMAFHQLAPEKNKTYLNYGCGAWSRCVHDLRTDGWNVYGYEPYAKTTDEPYILTSLDELALIKFDGIFSNNVLEHLRNPVDDLKFMKSLLKDSSSIMVHSTPCYEYLYEYTRFHVVFFTGKSIHYICNDAGLIAYDRFDNNITENPFSSYKMKPLMQPIPIADATKIDLSLSKPLSGIAEPNDRLTLSVLLNNKSSIILTSEHDFPLFTSYHWLDRDGEMVDFEGIRSKLPSSILPLTEAVCETQVLTPKNSGKYILRLTLVQESVLWFDEPSIDVKIDISFEIKDMLWWSAAYVNSIVYGNIDVMNKARFKKYLSFDNRCKPPFLLIETCNICPLNCIICPSSKMTGKREIMDDSLFEKAVLDYCSMGGGDISLSPTRGEVFLDNHLVNRVEFLNRADRIKNISFTTNAVEASRFNDEDLSFIINSTFMIQVSIYGLNEEEYSLMSDRKGYYEKMIRSVRRIIHLNKKSNITLSFRFLIDHSTEKIEKWIKDNFGCNLLYSYILNYMNWGGDMDISGKLPFDAKWIKPTGEYRDPCLLPAVSTKVFVNGDVKFCACVDYNNVSENTLGNIREDTLANIYNGERAKALWQKGFSKCSVCTAYRPLSSINDIYLADILDKPSLYLGG